MFFTKRMLPFLVAVFLVLAAAVAYAVNVDKKVTGLPAVTDHRNTVGKADKDAAFSKIVLNVNDMSCSGCISTIKGALAGFQGIEDVLVDLSGGKVEVYYDGEKLKDVSEVEKAIAASGYPARIVKTVSPEEIRKERDLAASKSEYYIASVSGYDISKTDFTIEMNAAKQEFRRNYSEQFFTTPQGQALEERLKAQVAGRLIDEAVLLQAISRSGFKVDEDEIRSEWAKYVGENGKNKKAFQQSLKESGYSYDYFMRKFERMLLINRYVDEKVLVEASTPYEKQRLFTSWFNDSRNLSQIVYYDRDLEQSVRNLSASGSCCAAR